MTSLNPAAMVVPSITFNSDAAYATEDAAVALLLQDRAPAHALSAKAVHCC